MKPLLTFSLCLILAITGIFSIDTYAQDGADNVIRAENVHDLEHLERFGHGTRDAFAWTADESVLAVGGSLGVWLYDGQDLEAEPRYLPNSPANVHHVAFNGDGTQIAVGWGLEDDEQGLLILDVESGDTVLELAETVRDDPGVQFSADGSVFVAQTFRGVLVWDMLEMVEQHVFRMSEAVALSPDGNWLAVKSPAVLYTDALIMNLQTGEERIFAPEDFRAGGPMGPALGLIGLGFTEYDGEMVLATLHEEEDHVNWLRVLRYWELSTGAVLERVATGSGLYDIHQRIPQEDQALPSTINWSSIDLFHVGGNRNAPLPQPLLQFNPSYLVSDGEILVTSKAYSSQLEIWDLATGERIEVLDGEGGSIHALAINPEGTIIAAGMDEFLNIWLLNEQGDFEEMVMDTGHSSIITELSISDDGSDIVTISFAEVFEWSWDAVLANPPNLDRMSGEDDPRINDIVLSPDHTMAAYKSPDFVTIVDMKTGEEIRQLDESDLFIRRLAFSPDGSRLYGITGSYDEASGSIGNRDFLGYIVVWDVESGKYLGPLGDTSINLDEMAISPDGSIVVVRPSRANDGATIFDATSGEVLRELDATGVPIFSADGSKLYFADSGVIQVWGLVASE